MCKGDRKECDVDELEGLRDDLSPKLWTLARILIEHGGECEYFTSLADGVPMVDLVKVYMVTVEYLRSQI